MWWRSMVRMEGLRLASPARAAVVALGNPYRGDDGVGPAVLRALRSVIREPLSVTRYPLSVKSGEAYATSTVPGSRLTDHGSRITDYGSRITDYDLLESAHGGLPLAQALVGYRRALIVDAAPFLPAGELLLFPITDHGSRITDHVQWLHGLGLPEAFSALEKAGFAVPECWALAIGVPPDPPFGEGLSPEVAAAVPRAVEEVKAWLSL